MAGIARPEGEYAERAELSYDPNVTRTYLQLGQLTLADEAVYKCELTFLEVRDGCPVVQFVNLTALIKPEYVKITKGDGSSIQNSSLIGPFPEDEKLELVCESGGGKPLPAISWWNGSRLIPSKAEVENAPGGSSKSRSKISLKLGRGDLGAKYECRVASPALGDQGGMVLSWVEVDVHVRPRKLELGGVEHHVVQGTEVTLRCHVSGARPAANVTWYNGTEVIPTDNVLSDAAVQPPETKVQTSSDGTYETQSRFSFRATRYENGGSISCEATNPVIQAKGEQPMKSTIALEVLYPPIAWVSPDNATLNETSDVSIVCSYEANPPTPKEIIWYRDGKELVLDGERLEIAETESFQGKEPGQSPWGRSILSIKNASRDDGGAYSCMPENEVGSSESTNQAYVSVYFKPEVKLMMDPLTPVSEIDKLNITLLCRVEAGNPETLLSVRWYLDGELLKELPDCRGNDSSEANSSDDSLFCDIDPSKLLLEDVSRSFHGNYSCEGMNEAGWGPLSPEEELIVHYPPGPATLVYDPPQVLKKSWVTLSCSVEDPGRPEATPNSFKWFRGGHPVIDVTTANWTIEPVTLETQSNFTCLAANAGGEGEPATVYVEVAAPPAFIERLPPYHGALMHAEHVSVSCRVECSPICQVRWLKNGRPLVEDGPQSSLYSIRTSELPPDPRTNDFKSVVSTLLWNMSAWPGGRLDRILDNANYTCESTANAVGPGVTSTTFFGVEYPPENITVSPQIVSVVEGQIPDKIVCSAKAYPEASYHWWRRRQSDNDGSSSNSLVIDPQTSSIVVKGNALVLNYPVPRTDGGEYICEAYNRHGNATIKTHVNVLHKPECGITQTEVNGKLVLICRASANPAEVDFFWRIKNGSENETVEENVESGGPLSSILTLETRVENFRTYLCFANNSVGMSIPCERDVTAYQEKSISQSWWKKLENDNVLIIVAIIVGAVVMVIIVCIIIIIVCRRRRAEDKYPSLSATRDKSNQGKTPDGNMGGSQPDDDRAFYENLPFHGLQNPPNKCPSPPKLCASHNLSSQANDSDPPPIPPRKPTNQQPASNIPQPPPSITQPAPTRPPSQSSRAASSGYGSTRSCAGNGRKPLPWSNLTSVRLYSSMRLARDRKRANLPAKSFSWSKWMLGHGTMQRFRSRAVGHLASISGGKGDGEDEREARQDEGHTSNSTQANNESVLAGNPSSPSTSSHPVPAPRTGTLLRSKHTYQNVPAPKNTLETSRLQVTSTNSTSPFSISMGQQWQQHPSSNNCGSLHRGSNRSASHANSRGIGVGRTGAESSILTPIAPVPTLCPPGGQQSCPPQQILRPKPQHHHSREWGDPRRMATESLHSNRPANATNSLTRNGVDHYAGNGSTHRHRHAAESPISMHTLPHQKKNHHHHSGGNNQHIPAYNDSAATTAMSAAGGIMYADLSLRANGYPSGGPMAKGRGGMATSVGDRNSTEYAVLKFHDVGQEIDV
ncbi:hemicentin-1 isoform X3 [Ischnura elegans]|uniref:hemicentin-1 isoform X3 n=1 Tax=Ischnura elegans TaxID=197161 RepID=UPI001ED8A412|nr:hemicentin-1 isoform X3 [Ischnura elegans]